MLEINANELLDSKVFCSLILQRAFQLLEITQSTYKRIRLERVYNVRTIICLQKHDLVKVMIVYFAYIKKNIYFYHTIL